jgi:hypothetical protein
MSWRRSAGGIVRPMRWPEWIWAVTGASLLLVLGLMSIDAATGAVRKGLNAYLFLTGMMLLSETAREHGVFDWVAAAAVNRERRLMAGPLLRRNYCIARERFDQSRSFTWPLPRPGSCRSFM